MTSVIFNPQYKHNKPSIKREYIDCLHFTFHDIKVLLPTGTIITIQTSARGFINIWIKPSSVDRNKVTGINNSNCNNNTVNLILSHKLIESLNVKLIRF
jgi:hypothetical protein